MSETDPDYWFLDSVPTILGNKVEALVDGAAYMEHLYERMQGMQDGDTFFYTAWRGTPQQKLRPDLSKLDTSLVTQLLRLVQHRVGVHVLAWAVPLPSRHLSENISLVTQVRVAARGGVPGSSAFMDDRLPSRIASHHQKSIVLTCKGDPWAYIGGIDVSIDRWDTPDHMSPKERQRDILNAWHDVHCAIQGPAVAAIAENFRDRWNERKPPVSLAPSDLPTPIKAPLPVPEISRGNIAVQRLRTFACGGVYDFMKSGEQTSREGINRAIDRAKYFVYVEDQYFWPSTTVDSLTNAVRRGVHVLLVLAKEFDSPEPLATAHYQMRLIALKQLRSANPGNVTCCHLEQQHTKTQIYVHSKFMIVDDRFVTIGSTNVGRRSHTTDTELNVSMVDAELIDGFMARKPVKVCKFARDLRLRVWSEHLGVKPEDLNDPILSLSTWPLQRSGSKKVHHAAWHSGVPPDKPITFADWYRFIKALRDIADRINPWPNASKSELKTVETAFAIFDKLAPKFEGTSLTELAAHALLGPIWWAPKGVKEQLFTLVKKLMNVETKCDS